MRKVPPALSLVNSLVPMTTRGELLRAYILRVTGGAPGYQKALVEASGVKRQTISKYTKPTFDGFPDLGTLDQLAKGLRRPLFELIAAMDGEQAVALGDPLTREMLRDLLEVLLDERDEHRHLGMRPGRAG